MLTLAMIIMHRCTIVFDYRLPETVLSLHLYVALLETSKGRLSHILRRGPHAAHVGLHRTFRGLNTDIQLFPRP